MHQTVDQNENRACNIYSNARRLEHHPVVSHRHHALYCAGPTDTYARLFLGMLLDFDETSPLFAQRAATSWHAHERALGRRQRQSLELRVARMSSLAWWPRPPPKKEKVRARPPPPPRQG